MIADVDSRDVGLSPPTDLPLMLGSVLFSGLTYFLFFFFMVSPKRRLSQGFKSGNLLLSCDLSLNR